MSRVKDAGGSRRASTLQEALVLKLPGGATRSEQAPAYHLLPREGAKRIADRFDLGAKLHGEYNWMESVHFSEGAAKAFAAEAYNHMMDHALKMASGEAPEDDHLAAIGWAVYALAYVEGYYHKSWTELEGGV